MSIIEFKIHTDDPAQKVALYDRIQVHKSSTEDGTYVDITEDEATPAVAYAANNGPWVLDGQTLNFALNGAPAQSITFAGTNPIPLIEVLATINAAIPGFASESEEFPGRILLTSPVSGTQSSIDISAGGAQSVLGFTTGKVNGKAARLLLSANTEDYLFRDFDGLDTDWYKVRLYSSETGAISDFDAPFLGGPGTGLDNSFLVTGSLTLSDLTGAPVVGRRIIFVPVSPQVVNAGEAGLYGILPSVDRITVETNKNGKASIKLVKSQRLKVFIEGSTFQREFVVPDADFDILQVASVQPDPLDIVQAPPVPIRVS